MAIPNSKGDFIHYLVDSEYAYQFNCSALEDMDPSDLSAECNQMNKITSDEFFEKLRQTWLSEGVDLSNAAKNASHYKYGLGTSQSFSQDKFETFPDFAERLEKVFSPVPPSSGGVVVLGQMPKRPSIDPMVKQVVIWNLRDYPGTNMPLSGQQVLDAMNDLKTEYWGHSVDSQARQECLNRLIPEWSDIMFHYYCQIGPAQRCFNLQSKDHGHSLGGYSTSYEICKYDEKNNFKWIGRHQGDVFRYIMFTVGDPEAFNQADQDEVINTFYGVTDRSNCANRPMRNAPPNPEFPCGKKIGRITLKEQEDWTKKFSSITTSLNNTVTKNSLPANPKSDFVNSKKPTGDESDLNSQGFKFLGAVWYLTASGTSNCADLCASKGGYVEDVDKKIYLSSSCQSLSKQMVNSNTEFDPYRNGSGSCQSGCLVHSQKQQYFVCSESKPNSGFITLGWSRACPCAK